MSLPPPTLRANTLTADPLFRLMIAMEGEEPGAPSAPAAWRAFERFLSIPAIGEDDALFQAEWLEPAGTPILQVSFGRQLRDAALGGDTPYARQVLAQFTYESELPPAEERIELWLSDHESIAAFLRKAEQTTAYAFIRVAAPTDQVVFQQDDVWDGADVV